jgi:transcription-repair coupling factor (superfamily II helicase)
MQRNEKLLADLRRRVEHHPIVDEIVRSFGSRRLDVTGLPLEARALLIAAIQERTGKKMAIVVPGDAPLADLETSLRLFHRDPGCVAVFPNPSLSPYQEVEPTLAVLRDEIRALARLVRGSADILLVPARSLLRRLPSPEDFRSRMHLLAVGDELDVRSFLERLVENGFDRVDLVGEVGEFAFRGGIIDIFPPNLDRPVRIELFGDTLDSIRFFETETQRSEEAMDSIEIAPMAIFVSSKKNRDALARKLSVDFNDPHYKRDLADKIEKLSERQTFPGIDNYLPVALESTTLAAYLANDEWLSVVVEADEITTSLEKYQKLLESEFESAAEKGKAVYRPEGFLAPVAEAHAAVGAASLAMSDLYVASKEFDELRIRASAAPRYVNRLSELAGDLRDGRKKGFRTLLFTATRGGREKVERLLREFEIPFVDEPERLGDDPGVSEGSLPSGFQIESMSLEVLSEWDLFDPPASTRRGVRRKNREAFLTDLRDLKAGDYIVHAEHGIGRFAGLQRIPFGDTEREVMQLEYSSGGRLLLPMESLNLIQKYSGGADSEPKLDKLGGATWARTKASVKKAMRDMADELLKLYATRQMIPGHAFGKDTPWQFDFEEAFEFDETDDQLSAIEDIKHDMESRKPMDRLLCGDVGYGKTEVAMRAAFKSVMDGKQVAMLAPTTILAYQHYQTMLRRFASFPVTIELSSRFRSPKEQKEILRKAADGEIDILVGTHRILSREMKFKDLGLLIIDEEQRFGVAQKERLKQFKKAVDVLAMSATPIPRTLHMSLSGIRDISIIETPPKDRLAIQTAVVPFDADFVKEAIEFELNRKGQIFFVHNRVDSIHQMKEYIEKLVPGTRVAVGHGQMDEHELERTMMAFIKRDFDVLLATTIVENGIDIPSANTILIHHAERYGLSQLYQLRGRVGRSDRLAFCYLLVPSDRILTSDARKRLAAIQEFSDLGAGFRIAAKDLEIRGAGNMLGGEQSGQIAAVGFETYSKLLEETIRELKGEPVEEEIETSINLGIDIYIPHDYIEDENLRMTFYKKIASARDEKRLDEIHGEMRDRFGAVPENVEGLLDFVKLKQYAQQIGVLSIARDGKKIAIRFQPAAKIDPNAIFAFINEVPDAKFTPSGVLSFPLRSSGREIVEELRGFLERSAVVA